MCNRRFAINPGFSAPGVELVVHSLHLQLGSLLSSCLILVPLGHLVGLLLFPARSLLNLAGGLSSLERLLLDLGFSSAGNPRDLGLFSGDLTLDLELRLGIAVKGLANDMVARDAHGSPHLLVCELLGPPQLVGLVDLDAAPLPFTANSPALATAVSLAASSLARSAVTCSSIRLGATPSSSRLICNSRHLTSARRLRSCSRIPASGAR